MFSQGQYYKLCITCSLKQTAQGQTWTASDIGIFQSFSKEAQNQ